LVKAAIDKKAKKIYLHECLYKPRMTTGDLFDVMSKECGKSLVVADSAEPRLIEELKRMGINIKGAIKGQGSITAGIAIMQDYELIVSPSSENIAKELNNYSWHDKKSNVPIDAWNHALDASRYAISDMLEPKREAVFGW